MRFFLGTHLPAWLGFSEPWLFVSRRRLADRVSSWPRAVVPYAIDSGGFSELSLFGRWTVSPEQYVKEVRLWTEEIGPPQWAAAQDWMCEPDILAKTGLDVCEHQIRTVANYLDLIELAPEVPWTPVVQGFTLDEYLACVRLYESQGIDLSRCPIVGVGSVCRRQDTSSARAIFRALHGLGLTLHGFGVKSTGLVKALDWLASADSMAWSATARHDDPLTQCIGRHKNCANCYEYAVRWWDRLVVDIQCAGGTVEVQTEQLQDRIM